MSRSDWICISLILFGLFLFLYGANFYNEIAGWAGLVLFVGGIVALIVIFVYHLIVKTEPDKKIVQESVQKP